MFSHEMPKFDPPHFTVKVECCCFDPCENVIPSAKYSPISTVECLSFTVLFPFATEKIPNLLICLFLPLLVGLGFNLGIGIICNLC